MDTMGHKHFKLYKPFGMLSQLHSNDPKELRSKQFISALYDFPEGIMPIGRLDAKSEGLLLLTTDGKLSDTINRSGIEKEYYAQLDGEITAEAISQLKAGVTIGIQGKSHQTKPSAARILKAPPHFPPADVSLRLDGHRPNSWISITITEGKFRQIRKMTAAVGFPTLRLARVRVGDIHLGDLLPGQVKAVTLLL